MTGLLLVPVFYYLSVVRYVLLSSLLYHISLQIIKNYKQIYYRFMSFLFKKVI